MKLSFNIFRKFDINARYMMKTTQNCPHFRLTVMDDYGTKKPELNDDKTELMLITPQRTTSTSSISVNINSAITFYSSSPKSVLLEADIF